MLLWAFYLCYPLMVYICYFDLAGSKVEVNPLVTNKPSVDPNTDSIEQEIPGLLPSCAVTRSMTQSKSI